MRTQILRRAARLPPSFSPRFLPPFLSVREIGPKDDERRTPRCNLLDGSACVHARPSPAYQRTSPQSSPPLPPPPPPPPLPCPFSSTPTEPCLAPLRARTSLTRLRACAPGKILPGRARSSRDEPEIAIVHGGDDDPEETRNSRERERARRKRKIHARGVAECGEKEEEKRRRDTARA